MPSAVDSSHEVRTMTEPRLIDAAELAQRLGVSIRTIYRWDDYGFVPRSVRLRRSRRWRSDEIDTWIASGCKRVSDPLARFRPKPASRKPSRGTVSEQVQRLRDGRSQR